MEKKNLSIEELKEEFGIYQNDDDPILDEEPEEIVMYDLDGNIVDVNEEE